MDGAYEFDPHPFFFNRATNVRLYHGFSLKRGRIPVVIKRHDIYLVDKPQFLEDFNLVINAGLAQARADHSNACKIIEIRLDMNLSENCYSVFHILEAMEKDVGREVVERQAGDRRFTETDLAVFLGQTASALAFAHNKEIAHRDIKPGNIFMDRQGNYKVGDFGSFFEKKATMHTESVAGTLTYMSPQQRLIIAGQDVKYNPFKSDVFGLGFTTLSLASLTLLEQPWMLEGLEQRVKAVLSELQYSQSLKDLLQAMLSIREENRPDMQTVLEAASRLSKPEESLSRPLPSELYIQSAPSYYASIFNDTLTLYNLQSQHYTRHTLSINFGSGGSYIFLYEDTLLCIGSSPASTTIFSLSLSTLQLTPLRALLSAREAPGLAKSSKSVYIFGGWDTARRDILSSERITLAEGQPADIGNMRYPRAYFTPCPYSTLIYLISTRSKAHRAIETFNTDTEDFAEVQVYINPQIDLGCASVSFITDGELCILTANKQIARWKIESEREFRVGNIGKKCASTQPPLLLGTQVFIAYRRNVLRFSLENNAFL